MTFTRVFALALPLALAATGSTQTVLLRFKPRVGTKQSYTLSTDMTQTVPGMPAPMRTSVLVPMTLRVVSRAVNSTSVETKLGQAKVTVPAGSPVAGMKAALERTMSGMTSTTVYGELGNVQSVSGAAASAMGGVNNQMSLLPKKAVKVGDTWSETLDISKMLSNSAATAPGISSTGTIPIVFRLTGLKRAGRTTIAMISVSMKGKSMVTMPQGKMDLDIVSTGFRAIDVATGMFISTSMTSDIAMVVMGKDMHQHIVVSMK
jgi:hypothetical protein